MSLILRSVIGEARGRKAVATATADPALKKKLEDTQKNLNSILKKWKWDGAYPATSQEFLNKFSLWVDTRLKEIQDWKDFLSKWGSTSLNQLETTWQNTEQDYQRQIRELQNKPAEELSEELKEKLENYENLEVKNKELQAWADGQHARILELEAQVSREVPDLSAEDQEKLDNYDNLEAEKDQAIRDKTTLEQEVLATNNRLNLKAQEVQNKEQEIQRLKSEASEKEKSQKEKTKEIKEKLTKLEEKYRKREQLLDQEQTENNRLEGEIEKLQRKITELEKERKELLKNQKDL